MISDDVASVHLALRDAMAREDRVCRREVLRACADMLEVIKEQVMLLEGATIPVGLTGQLPEGVVSIASWKRGRA